MGSLVGHLLPGIFFFIFALYWSFITAIRYAQIRLRSPMDKNKLVGYRTSVTMPPICLPCKSWSKKPFESYVKLFVTTVGIIVEFIGGFGDGVNRDDVLFFGCEDIHGHSAHGMSAATTSHQPHNHAMHAATNTSMSNRAEQLGSKFSPQNTQHITMYAGNYSGRKISEIN